MPQTGSGADFELQVGNFIEKVFSQTHRFQRYKKRGEYKLNEIAETGGFRKLKQIVPERPTLIREEAFRTVRSRKYSRARDKNVDWRLALPSGTDFMIECKHQDVSGSVDEKIWEGIPNRLADGAYWSDWFLLFLSGDHFDDEAVSILQDRYERKRGGQAVVTTNWKRAVQEIHKRF